MKRSRRVIIVVAAVIVLLTCCGGVWAMAGRDLANSHNAATETTITPANASRLAKKWELALSGDVSATPAVQAGVLYVPDWGGGLTAIDTATGVAKWQKRIADYGTHPDAFSRSSPVIAGDNIYIGDQVKNKAHASGAWILAVNKKTGDLTWKTQVETHPAAIITGSPISADGKIYVGVSSTEPVLAADPGYACCTFRGSVVALDAITGQKLWQTYTTIDNRGQACAQSAPARGCAYSGGAIWGAPAVDLNRRSVFVGTGNNYTAPDADQECQRLAKQNGTPNGACSPPENHVDAVMSLDMDTGRIEWSTRATGYDAWNVACARQGPASAWCPDPFGEDYDFGGGGINHFSIKNPDGTTRDLVGGGQKSGIYWAFDADSGAQVWIRAVGPGSTQGGIMWGTAVDGERLYVPSANGGRQPTVLQPSGRSINWGSWSALDPKTGAILWQTADPGRGATFVTAGPAVANGVMFGGSLSNEGTSMYALDAATGSVLWSFNPGGSTAASPAIVDGVVYWGAGYEQGKFLGATKVAKIFAFSIDGR